MATGGDQNHQEFAGIQAVIRTKTSPSSSSSSSISLVSSPSSSPSTSPPSSPTHNDDLREGKTFSPTVLRPSNTFPPCQMPRQTTTTTTPSTSALSPYGTRGVERRSEASVLTKTPQKSTQSTGISTPWDRFSHAQKTETESRLTSENDRTHAAKNGSGTIGTRSGTPISLAGASAYVTTAKTTSSSSHLALSSPSSGTPVSCSVTCANNFIRLSKEVRETKDQLLDLSVQMAEQSSHINKLMEENRRYIRENGKLKKKSSSRSTATVLTPNNFDHFGNGEGRLATVDGEFEHTDEVLTELQDRVMALQIHNDELNVCLERERRRRREAEARVERDEGYIKRLEDNVQSLRGTRVVMDSNAYRQLAEAYIASRRPAARRHHSSHSHHGSDLVCDAPSNTSLGLPGMPLQTSSCPSSPKSDISASSTTSSHLYQDPQLFPAATRRNGSIRGPKERNSGERGSRTLSSGAMSPWDYQQLLENLENLDGANRGALS